jgi:hypothetical protein
VDSRFDGQDGGAEVTRASKALWGSLRIFSSLDPQKHTLLTLYDGEPNIPPLHYCHNDIDCHARRSCRPFRVVDKTLSIPAWPQAFALARRFQRHAGDTLRRDSAEPFAASVISRVIALAAWLSTGPEQHMDDDVFSPAFRLTLKAAGIASAGAILAFVSLRFGWNLSGIIGVLLITAGVVVAVIAPHIRKHD